MLQGVAPWVEGDLYSPPSEGAAGHVSTPAHCSRLSHAYLALPLAHLISLHPPEESG